MAGRKFGVMAGGLVAVASVVLVGSLTASGASADAVLARVVIVLVPYAVGLYAWYHQVDQRFGSMLLVCAATLTLSALAESGDPAVYTVGRVAGWAVELLFIHAVLSYPSGRLTGSDERRIVMAMALAIGVLFVPRLFVAEALDVPSPYTSCVAGCPGNPWFAFDAEPAFVEDLLRPAGALAVLAIAVWTTVVLYRRRAVATPSVRRGVTPVLVVAATFVVVHAAGVLARDTVGGLDLEPVAWVLAFRFPLLSLAFLAGPLRWRLFEARSLSRLTQSLLSSTSPASLRLAFADAFDDPDLLIVYPSSVPPREWQDATGRPVLLDGDGTTKVTEVRRDGRVVAAVRHDAGLLIAPEFVAAATAIAGFALDNHRLAASTEAALRDIRRSRDRLADSAEDERRRIERDLHDGAQQRLVALRIELGLAEDLVERDPEAAVRRLRMLELEVDAVLEEVRSLAQGVYPRLLMEDGLVAALRGAARRVRLPVEVRAQGVGRYPPETESAVYFCLLEALQNVLKHAPDARRVIIELRDVDAQLRFSLRDDGAGGRVEAGAGIANMRDRLAAVGGDVDVTSTPRVGTVVRGQAPMPAPNG